MDEKYNDSVTLDNTQAESQYAPDADELDSEFENYEEKIINKKSKQQKNQDKKDKDPESNTKKLLIAILSVGLCVLIVSLIGVFVTIDKRNNSIDVVDNETTTVAPVETQATTVADTQTTAANNENDVVTQETETASAQVVAGVENEAENNAEEVENNANAVASAPQSDAEWLAFFNTAVNKLKTDGPSFSKAKRTQTADIQLSNSLAQAYVSTAKDKYLSDETVVTEVSKGDTAKAVAVVSPDGESYVSNLTMDDIKSISYSTNADGNYEITINMPDSTNPDLSSSFAKIFEFMLVDDVMDTYAPNMGATVDRTNVSLEYSGCYASAVITPQGQLISYHTTVSANMILKSAKISIVTTDLDALLYSDTDYTNISW